MFSVLLYAESSTQTGGLKSDNLLALDVPDNEVTITFNHYADKCYEVTLSAQHPMQDVTIFRVQYTYFDGGSSLENAYAFFTLMPGDSVATVTIDKSSNRYFTIMTSPLIVETQQPGASYYNFIYTFEFPSF